MQQIRNQVFLVLAVMLLTGLVLAQNDQPQPYSFKDDILGMGLEEFKAKHVDPGSWQDEATKIVSIGDSHNPPRSAGDWKWKPDLDCRDVMRGVIVRCQYETTIAGIPWAHVAAVFVDGKLAAINVSYSTQSPVVRQALIDKLGQPMRIPVSGNSNRDLYALRWDNGVSVVELQEHYCGSGSDNSQQGWSKDVTEVLRGIYCDNSDAGDYGSAFIWYVHRSLSTFAMSRWEGTIEDIREKARSEPFSFDDALEMPVQDFEAKHRDHSCKETFKHITECDYSANIMGIRAFATAIFADEKLAATHFYYLAIEGHSAVVSGVGVPVDVKQALISTFGQPQIIRGYGDSALTADDRRSFQWDEGASVVEYQSNGCSSGNEYEWISRVLQRRYCEANESGDGTVSIWHIDKALSATLSSRYKEGQENTRKKARSDL